MYAVIEYADNVDDPGVISVVLFKQHEKAITYANNVQTKLIPNAEPSVTRVEIFECRKHETISTSFLR